VAAPDKWQLLRAFEASSGDEALADALVAVWDGARAAWPGVELAPERFMGWLAARHQGDLAALRTGDLYLACACLQRDGQALAALDAAVISRLGRAIEGVEPSRDFVDEVSQRVRERLILGDPPRLTEYAGQGSLLGWARTMAVRLALNLKRDGGKEQPEEAELFAQVPLSGPDVELQYVRAQHRADFTGAFKDALAGLDPRERNLLRLSYLDRLAIDQIGAIYRVHRATAARWLNAARETLVAGTREHLGARLKPSVEELDALLAALQSNMEISLKGMLDGS
jgi:RNA polymerase sigma-70 factor (ECF subfamily)